MFDLIMLILCCIGLFFNPRKALFFVVCVNLLIFNLSNLLGFQHIGSTYYLLAAYIGLISTTVSTRFKNNTVNIYVFALSAVYNAISYFEYPTTLSIFHGGYVKFMSVLLLALVINIYWTGRLRGICVKWLRVARQRYTSFMHVSAWLRIRGLQ